DYYCLSHDVIVSAWVF
nr:immunoglobulin light chain junction region [Macaca mulatta]